MAGMDALAQAKYSARMLDVYSSQLRYAAMCNRDYEGEVTMGGSVKIFMPGDPTINTFTRDSTTISYERVAPGEQVMQITKREYFAIKADDLEKAWAFAGGALWQRTIQRGSYGLAKSVDTYVGGTVMAGAVPTANTLTARTLGTGLASNAYELLVDMARVLRDADVPMNDVSVAVPPALVSLLHKDDRFTSFNTADARRTIAGAPIGQVEEMMVLETTNCPVSGSTYKIIAASKDAVTFADMFGELEQVPRQAADFDDRVRSELVYDAKVVQPRGLAMCSVQFTA